jgi:hypothetical protein
VALIIAGGFESVDGERLGVDVLEPGLLIARIVASNGARFAALRAAIRRTARRIDFRTAERPRAEVN